MKAYALPNRHVTLADEAGVEDRPLLLLSAQTQGEADALLRFLDEWKRGRDITLMQHTESGVRQNGSRRG